MNISILTDRRQSNRLWASLLFALVPLTATAQSARERPRYVLQALDRNHDGMLSAEEVAQAPAALLSLDRNGDGQLSPDQLEQPRPDAGATPDQLVAQLMTFDRNGLVPRPSRRTRNAWSLGSIL